MDVIRDEDRVLVLDVLQFVVNQRLAELAVTAGAFADVVLLAEKLRVVNVAEEMFLILVDQVEVHTFY